MKIFFERLLVVVCCTAVLMGCKGRETVRKGWNDSIAVQVLVVNSGDTPNQREYVGDVGSEIELDMGFTLGGTLTNVAVRNGQKVSKNQLLAEVDATTANSLLNASLATLHQAEDAYDRLKSVHQDGGISDVRWVQMETDLEKARQSVVAARKRVEQCVLRAPFDGVVSCGTHHVGEELSPLQPFARLVDLSRLRVGFSVPEQEMGLLSIGSVATATVSSLDDRELKLRISDKSLLANPLGHTYRVYGTIVGGDTKGLLPDMVAKVHVALTDLSGIVVPSESVQTMPEGTIVWVVKGGKAYHRLVNISDFVSNGVMVEEGLQAGDTVVVGGKQKLYSGAKVKILD